MELKTIQASSCVWMDRIPSWCCSTMRKALHLQKIANMFNAWKMLGWVVLAAFWAGIQESVNINKDENFVSEYFTWRKKNQPTSRRKIEPYNLEIRGFINLFQWYTKVPWINFFPRSNKHTPQWPKIQIFYASLKSYSVLSTSFSISMHSALFASWHRCFQDCIDWWSQSKVRQRGSIIWKIKIQS